jgi:hypothetical protein
MNILKHPSLVIFFSALFVKVVFFINFLESPFRYFYTVSGLDMKTLLEFSSFTNLDTRLCVPHRWLIYFFYYLNNNTHNTIAVIIVQAILGVLGAVLLGECARILFNSKKAQLFCGLFYAFYGPVLVYEFSILQESLIINFLIIGFYFLLKARLKNYSWKQTIPGGIFLAATSLGRPATLLFLVAIIILFSLKVDNNLLKVESFSTFSKRFINSLSIKYKALFRISLIIFLTFVFGAFFNKVLVNTWSPFFYSHSYAQEFNYQKDNVKKDIKEDQSNQLLNRSIPNNSAKASWFRVGMNALKRMPQMLLAREIPENLNYNFLRLKISSLKFLIGPEILLTLGLTALIFIFLKGCFFKKEALVIYLIISLLPLLCVRDPIGRYRLYIVPLVILLLPVLYTLVKNNKDFIKVLSIFTLVIIVNFIATFGILDLRSSDYIAWALANESKLALLVKETPNNPQKIKVVKDEILDSFYTAWVNSNYNNNNSGVNYLLRLLQYGNIPEAVNVINIGKNTATPDVYYYYHSLILSNSNVKESKQLLSKVKVENIPLLKDKYYKLKEYLASKEDKK